ncbi:MAG: amidohydrolase family protein [Acidobacteria bacterium]|nr:amidohydrolase family protein [Acidobacteriota bacterium]
MLGIARHFVYAFLFCALSVSTFASPPPAQSNTIVISHVNVIPMDTERVLEDRTVIVRDGKIWKIAAGEGSEPPPKGALVIDGRGKFLMPGLADLHVHLFSSDDLPAYVFYGVTTVLNMDGGPQHLRWRTQVRDGKILGPAIYTAGHTIDGFPPLNEMFLTVETPEQGRALVREQKRAGYDVIKLYGTLRPDVFRAILDAAVQEKIPVVGHINRQVGALEVLKSSQALAAHLEDLLFARFDHLPSDAELEEFAAAIAQSRITVTPNLNVNPTNIAQLENLDAVLKSQPAKLLSSAAYSQWMPANNRNERNDQTPQQIEMMKGSQQMLYKMVRLLQAKNVRLVLGTDAAPYGFPGLSAHQELQELAEAGFTPYQALRTATLDAGSFIADTLPGSPRIGTVTEGAEADLLLLSSNPLTDIKHTGDIAGVILRGRWLSADEISSQRTATENRFATVKRETERIDAALDSGDTGPAEEWAKNSKAESPCIAEWVLMSKVRKLQGKDLPAAIRIARLDAKWYPESFSARYLLADQLFQAGTFAEASKTVKESLTLEPHSAAALNLVEKIAMAQQPTRFNAPGSYKIEYVNDQSHDAQKVELVIEGNAKGPFHGKSIRGSDTNSLQSLTVGGDRLWAVANSGYGPLEFRITVHGDELSGYWAGPFGQNGTLRGTKSK